MSTDDLQPGWYSDPTGRFEQRCFDDAWTDRTRTGDTESSDPIPDAARGFLPGPVGVATDDHAIPTTDVAVSRSNKRRIVWAVVAVVGVSIVIAAVAGGGDDTSETVKRSVGQPKSSVAQRSSSDATPTTNRATTPARSIAIEGQGFTQLAPNSIGSSYASYGVVLKNTSASDAATSVNVNIAFYNDANTVVGSESEIVSLVLPGQRVGVGSSATVAGATRMTVQVLPRSWQTLTTPAGSFTAEGVTISADRYTFATRGELVSTFAKDLQQVKAVAIYRDAAGAIIGGDFTYVNFVPAGGRAAVEISDFTQVPGVASAEILAAITSLSLAAS